jgi:hypothetical protein
MYLKMKTKVIRFCESCALFCGQLLVVVLGGLVVTALGFAIYQSVLSMLG